MNMTTRIKFYKLVIRLLVQVLYSVERNRNPCSQDWNWTNQLRRDADAFLDENS